MRPGTNWSSGASLKYSTPWSSEFAQFPTPTIATRTLPSSSRARPFVELPLVDIRASVKKLLADVQDALDDGEPGGRREDDDRPGQAAPGRKDQPRSDHDDALGA